MAYKIAVATSDQRKVNVSFRDAEEFSIYQVDESGEAQLLEKREFRIEDEVLEKSLQEDCDTQSSCSTNSGCGSKNGCGGQNSPKVDLIADCRCVICTKAGFNIQKKLEKKAISIFDVDCGIEEALDKIIRYFKRVDAHQNLRGFLKEASNS